MKLTDKCTFMMGVTNEGIFVSVQCKLIDRNPFIKVNKQNVIYPTRYQRNAESYAYVKIY